MTTDWTWGGLFQILLGAAQWTLAILSVGGTLALFGWIVMMVVRKDKTK